MTRSQGLQGGLRLVAAVSGPHTSLAEQFFTAPMHIGKPYRSHGCLVVHLINPTAGYFSGDRAFIDVRVETGARLVLSSPSATRIHAMPHGEAVLTQTYVAAAGAMLEVWPELLIPQRGAAFRQSIIVQAAPGAKVAFFDMLAPGRVAHGEILEFSELKLALSFSSPGVSLLENARITPASPALLDLRKRFLAPYLGTALITGVAGERFAARVCALEPENAVAGATALSDDMVAVKIVAGSSPALRKRLFQMREWTYAEWGTPEPVVRRL